MFAERFTAPVQSRPSDGDEEGVCDDERRSGRDHDYRAETQSAGPGRWTAFSVLTAAEAFSTPPNDPIPMRR